MQVDGRERGTPWVLISVRLSLPAACRPASSLPCAPLLFFFLPQRFPLSPSYLLSFLISFFVLPSGPCLFLVSSSRLPFRQHTTSYVSPTSGQRVWLFSSSFLFFFRLSPFELVAFFLPSRLATVFFIHLFVKRFVSVYNFASRLHIDFLSSQSSWTTSHANTRRDTARDTLINRSVEEQSVIQATLRSPRLIRVHTRTHTYQPTFSVFQQLSSSRLWHPWC